MTPKPLFCLQIPNYFCALLPCHALLPVSILNLARRWGDVRIGLLPFLHLQLPGAESQQATGNTSVQESEAAVPNNKVFYQPYLTRHQLCLPCRGKSSTHSAKSLGKVHGATRWGAWVGCSIKTADIHSPSLLFSHPNWLPPASSLRFPLCGCSSPPSLARSYINPRPSFAKSTPCPKGQSELWCFRRSLTGNGAAGAGLSAGRADSFCYPRT